MIFLFKFEFQEIYLFRSDLFLNFLLPAANSHASFASLKILQINEQPNIVHKFLFKL